jgi:hypothetical protein
VPSKNHGMFLKEKPRTILKFSRNHMKKTVSSKRVKILGFSIRTMKITTKI